MQTAKFLKEWCKSDRIVSLEARFQTYSTKSKAKYKARYTKVILTQILSNFNSKRCIKYRLVTTQVS